MKLTKSDFKKLARALNDIGVLAEKLNVGYDNGDLSLRQSDACHMLNTATDIVNQAELLLIKE